MSYYLLMSIIFDWDSEKNKLLINSRGVSFEEVIAAIENGSVLDVLEHPNQDKYSHQKIYVVEINSYVYLDPFVQDKNRIFLKTIIPNRKARKKYLNNN
ncbi:MAG TPA: toxin [Gammaproteobacteria bacterium]|nr:toxin [Gammaproteobacteria bacterium]